MANFTLDKTTGTGSDTLTISTSTNLGRATKTGTVTITSKVDTTKKATVALSQTGTVNYWSVVTAPTVAPALRKASDPPTVNTFTSVGVFRTNVTSYKFKLDTANTTANIAGRVKSIKIEISPDNKTWTVAHEAGQSGWTTDLTPAKLKDATEFEKAFPKYGLNSAYYIRFTVGFGENSKDAATANFGLNVYLSDNTTKIASMKYSQAGYSSAVSVAVDATTKSLAASATSAQIKLTTNTAWTATVV